MIKYLAMLIIQLTGGGVYCLEDFTGWVSEQKNPALQRLGSIAILVFAFPLMGAVILSEIIVKALPPQSDVIDKQEDRE